MLDNLNERIAYYRKKCGLTQEELAEQCSVTPQAVSKWENGLTAPDISLLPRLAQIFGCTTDALLGLEKPETAALAAGDFDPAKALLKVHVETVSGDQVVVNLPFAAAQVILQSGGFRMGENDDVMKNIDFEQIASLVNAGVIGKLVEVTTGDGDRVEIWVE